MFQLFLGIHNLNETCSAAMSVGFAGNVLVLYIANEGFWYSYQSVRPDWQKMWFSPNKTHDGITVSDHTLAGLCWHHEPRNKHRWRFQQYKFILSRNSAKFTVHGMLSLSIDLMAGSGRYEAYRVTSMDAVFSNTNVCYPEIVPNLHYIGCFPCQ